MAESGLTGKELRKQISKYEDDLFNINSDVSNEMGRAFGILRKDVSIKQLAKIATGIKNGLNERQHANFKNLDITNPVDVKRFIDELDE